MKLVFLGTSGGMPTKDRGLPSIALIYGGVHLFDIGEGTQRQMMIYGVRYGAVKNIFISHMHPDHYLGLFGLLQTYKMMSRKETLHIYSPIELAFPEFVEWHPLKEGVLMQHRLFTVSAFRVRHSKDSHGFLVETGWRWRFNKERAKNAGIRGRAFKELERRGRVIVAGREIHIEEVAQQVEGPKFLYTGDTVFMKKVADLAKNAVLIHDSTFSEKDREEAEKKRHATAVDAAMAAAGGPARMLILTHFSPRYTDAQILEKEAKKIFKKTKAAYDGLEINLLSLF